MQKHISNNNFDIAFWIWFRRVCNPKWDVGVNTGSTFYRIFDKYHNTDALVFVANGNVYNYQNILIDNIYTII